MRWFFFFPFFKIITRIVTTHRLFLSFLREKRISRSELNRRVVDREKKERVENPERAIKYSSCEWKWRAGKNSIFQRWLNSRFSEGGGKKIFYRAWKLTGRFIKTRAINICREKCRFVPFSISAAPGWWWLAHRCARRSPIVYIRFYFARNWRIFFFLPPSLLLSVKSFTRKRITARHEQTDGRTESKSGANQNDISAHTVHLTRGGCLSPVPPSFNSAGWWTFAVEIFEFRSSFGREKIEIENAGFEEESESE